MAVPHPTGADPAVRDLVAGLLRDIPDFPKPGVLFKDFTPLLANGPALQAITDDVVRRYAGQVDVVVGVEARGFILGAAVAYALGVGFVPVRKAGKLPGRTHQAEYTLEYGTATLELHVDAFLEGERALIMDDVLATGGTAVATCDLVERAGATVTALEFVLDIGFLKGRDALAGRQVHSLITS
ncbi:MAG: adenine phosphoribosyltransferase [Dermatophilaceae bacterium]|jgi:adenine phosphoribosyltransferase|nr:adenine phosphoribosyltransferase [Actinomycetales bacterium]MBP8879610.1 adenine phosphoribosyltransferase [Dermatophilaceae bacterium]MBP9916959.1 adenine phosphoribosyltransferase [Dermatophilaceae bacterium]